MSGVSALHGGALFNLAGAVALVTGGGTGIGLMCARTLAANGAKVYISGRRAEVVESAAKQYSPEIEELGNGGKLVPLQGDVSNKQSLKELADKIRQADGKLHVLVNNAGVEGPVTKIDAPEKMSAEQLSEQHLGNEDFESWDKLFSINNHSLFFSTMTFLPLLAKGNASPPSSRSASFPKWTASVINITSISGVVKLSQSHYGYNSSKAAANSLTQMLAHELNFRSHLGVRVNAIAPGLFMTEMTAGKGAGSRVDPEDQKASGFTNPAGRCGTEAEMGQLCLYLATNLFQQGQVVVLDGGFTTAVASNM